MQTNFSRSAGLLILSFLCLTLSVHAYLPGGFMLKSNSESNVTDTTEGEAEETELQDEEAAAKLAVVLSIFALAITLCAGHVIEGVWKITVLPEAAFAVLVGIVFGALIFAFQSGEGGHVGNMVRFDKEFFFFWLLPPIIFEAGYNMKRKEFFDNIVPTLLFAFIGTFVSTLVVGGIVYWAGFQGLCHDLGLLPSFVFGALISATDPVTVLAVFQSLGVDINLFSMVFGESVLNDAVAIVLYRTIMNFKAQPFTLASVTDAGLLFTKIFVLSFLIGVALAILSSIVLKLLNLRHDNHHIVVEATLTILFPWSAYFIAESCELSGIVAILFAGITMAYYTFENLSEGAQQLTQNLFRVAAKVAETFVFIYLGLSLFAFQGSYEIGDLLMFRNYDIRLTLVAIVACLIARLFNIVPCSFLTNLFRSGPPKTMPKLSGAFQFMLWFSGLRGGVAFAIAVVNFADNEFPENENSLQILQTTLFVALFTIFIFGGAITKLSIYLGVLESQKGNAIETQDMISGVPRSDEPPSTLPRKKSAFQKIDRRLKPILTHHRHVEDDQL